MTRETEQLDHRPSAWAIGFELWVFVLVAFAGTTLLWTQPTLRLAALAIFALPVLLWAFVRVRGPVDLLDVAILVGIAAHVAVSFVSLDRESSLEASAIVVAYAAVYWLARHVAAQRELRRVTLIAVVMALTFWAVVIAATWIVEKVADLQVFGWPPRIEAYQAYAWGSINTPPVLLLLAVPFVAWLPRGGFRRSVTVLLALAALVIVPFSVGRAAWAGIAVALISFEILSGFPLLRRVTSPLHRGGRRLAFAAFAVAGIAVTTLALSRSGDVAQALDSRIRLWQQAVGLFLSDPLTGAGPTTFAWARLAHVPDYVDRVAAGAAHNVPMQTLADGGVVLAGALLFIVAAWLSLVARGRRAPEHAQRVALAVLVGFGAFSLLDDFSFLPAVTVLVIILAAWVLPPRVAGARDRRLTARLLTTSAILLIAVVLTVPAAVSLGMMRIGLERTYAAAVDGEWEAALAGFRSASEVQPSNALHWMGIGLAEHRLGRDGAAREAYRTAATVSPGDPRPWGAQGALADGDGRTDLLRAAARRSNVPQYAYRLGAALQERDDERGAAEYFAIASIIQPGVYAAVPTEIRSQVGAALGHAEAMVGSLGGRNPEEAAWNAALAEGSVHPNAPVQWEVAHRVAAGDELGASSFLEQAMRHAAHSPRTWEAASAVARMTCDRAAFDAAEGLLSVVGRESISAGHGIEIRRPGLYREPDLGDYQPLDTPSLPHVPQWPLGLIEVDDCGW